MHAGCMHWLPALRLKIALSLLITLLSFSSVSGQPVPLGQRPITLKSQNIRIADLFSAIWEQTGLEAFYQEALLSGDLRVSVNFKNEPLDNVLASLLRERNLTWYYRLETYVIVPRRPDEPLLGEIPVQHLDITGWVFSTDGLPAAGVYVMTGNGRRVVVTDESGKFYFPGLRYSDQLVFKKMGFMTQYVNRLQDSLLIRMPPLVISLDIVNILGNSSRRLATGAISSISPSELGEQSASNVLAVLQGRVPGLDIIQTTGLPGGGFKMNIRGKNSLLNGNDPLVVVDGVPFKTLSINEDYINGIGSDAGLGANLSASPLNLVAIQDIARIDVLKDAEATAAYGSRGANGVIAITTKTPQPGDKSFSVDAFSGWGKASHLIRYLSPAEYFQMRREAFSNDFRAWGPADYDMVKWNRAVTTDWQKEMIGGTAHLQNAFAEWKVGKDKYGIRFSGLYRRETTLYPSSNFRYHKASGSAKLYYGKPKDRLKATLSLGYVTDQNVLPSVDLTKFSTLAPNTQAYKSDGSLNFEDAAFINPYAYLLRMYKVSSNSLRSAAVINYEPVKGLMIKTSAGYTAIKSSEIQINPLRSLNPLSAGDSSWSNFVDHKIGNWVFEGTVKYLYALGNEHFSTTAGYTWQRDFQKKSGFSATGFPDEDRLENKAAAKQLTSTGFVDDSSHLTSLYAAMSWDHREKYLVNLTARRDGSDRLRGPERFSTFGSIGVGWIFTAEPWFHNIPWFSFGKLHASYGTAGNDQLLPASSRDLAVESPVPQSPHRSGKQLTAPETYGFEKIRKWDAGIDMSFGGGLARLSFSWYHNQASDQVLPYRYPYFDTVRTVLVNYPAVVENKGVELLIEGYLLNRKELSWYCSLNLTLPQNRLKAFPAFEATSFRHYFEVGMPLDLFKGEHLEGVDSQTGIYHFKEAPGGTRESFDFPKSLARSVYAGFSNKVIWKTWELNIFLRYVKQHSYGYPFAPVPIAPGGMVNQPVSVLGRWQQHTHISEVRTIQKFTSTMDSDAGQAFMTVQESDQWITGASFLRLQQLSLSYSLPEHALLKFSVKNCKLYLQGQNLLTLTKYKGRDPETATNADIYPTLRVFTAGMQVTF